MSKKSRILVLFMLLSFVLVLVGISQLQAAEKVICPVTGSEFEKTDTTPSFEFKGETYYFCCPGCKDKFEKNPEEYLDKEEETLHLHGEEAKNVEHGEAEMHAENSEESMHQQEESETAIDPVCGMKVKKEGAKLTFVHNEKTYYFCSAGCKDKFAENPDAYLKAVDPVCGMKVTKEGAKLTYVHNEKTYYFCSAGCKEKFIADPEKYIKGI
ncbi:MAG: YHS domain-containing protein [Candidatus Aminicenantes bacterium]|nr:YHS domain-containing protein [Candidatus Aminicenantes bacterium]